MKKKLLVTIQGDYLGKIVDMQFNPDGTIVVTTEKFIIYEAVPVTNLSITQLIKTWRAMKEKALQQKAALLLVLANVKYDQKTIVQDDILPILYPDADAVIVLRTRSWERLPYESIGVASPEEADQIAKWYTLFVALKGTVLHYHRELDRMRLELVRLAEYARKLEETVAEKAKLLTELQKKVVDLHSEINSLIQTVENFDKMIQLKSEETELWADAYMKLKKKLRELLDVVPTIIELSNRLATMELEKEVEIGTLKQDLAKLEEEVARAIRSVSKLQEEVGEIKKTITETTITPPPTEEKQEKQQEETKPTGSEEEGEEEFLG